MEFEVFFQSPDDTEIIQHMGAAGLDILDILRVRFPKLKKLALGDIHISTSCPLNYNKCHLALTEQQARETGLFNGRTRISVNVPEFFFSRFIDWSYEETREVIRGFKFLKGRLKNVSLEQVMDIEALYDAWKSAKFTQWWEVEQPNDKLIPKSIEPPKKKDYGNDYHQ